MLNRRKDVQMQIWNIYLVSPHTGDKKELLYQYANKGHALKKIQGLRRKAWLASSETTYSLVDGAIRY